MSSITATSLTTTQPLRSMPMHRSGGDGDGDGSGGGNGASAVSGTTWVGGLMQSLLQSIGIVASATGVSGSTGAAGSTNGTSAVTPTASGSASNAKLRPDLHRFMQALFQALQANGLGGTANDSPTGSTNSGTTVAGAYSGGFASSLQSLIQQIGSGTGGSAVGQLGSAYDQLVRDAGGGTASSGSLQGFLAGFATTLQGNGVSPPTALGNNVNTNI